MLDIFNKLEPFIKDNYARINVREYAKKINVSPPSSSKILKNFEKEGLLKSEKDKLSINFYANKKNSLFINLQRAFYMQYFRKIGLIGYIEDKLLNPVIIMFGSFANAEIGPNSDVDIAIFCSSKKELEMKEFEKKLDREIQIFMFKNKDEAMKNEELFNNILNGFIISGKW